MMVIISRDAVLGSLVWTLITLSSPRLY